MSKKLRFGLMLAVAMHCSGGEVQTINFPASTKPGGLAIEATYHLWLPPKVRRIRAVIVHQHGCGEATERFGDLAVQDLHWRALATKHDAAYVCPHYRTLGAECNVWYDPRNGSGPALLRALDEFATRTGHPELKSAPLCLWGHSGGGVWASLMLEQCPERIVALFCRSGAAAGCGGVREPEFSPGAYGVTVLLSPGWLERSNAMAWDNCERFFERFRAHHAPVAFAPDPVSKHDCRNSRLLAIPYFDACLNARLGSRQILKPVNIARGWAGDWEHKTVQPMREIPSELSWLPDKATAEAFKEYVTTGIVTDHTAPRSRPELTSVKRVKGGVELKWTAEADLDSGIRQFAIYRDSKRIALWPEEFDRQTGYEQFQGISFHDTPVSRRPPMAFTDASAPTGARPRYSVATINGSGLEGPRSKSQRPDLEIK